MLTSGERGANSSLSYTADGIRQNLAERKFSIEAGEAYARLKQSSDWKLLVDEYLFKQNIKSLHHDLVYANDAEERSHVLQDLLGLLGIQEKLRLLPQIVATSLNGVEELEQMLHDKENEEDMTDA